MFHSLLLEEVPLPDRLIGNHDLGPLVLGQNVGDGVELPCHDVDGLVGFTLLDARISDRCANRATLETTYLQTLTDAQNDTESTVDGSLGLASNELFKGGKQYDQPSIAN
jgi:hypothetical protein